ncbi:MULTISPECIES: hypothetical protein [unclassified Exiguobacterium]|uniref:hypothetical protein n=1 Tax=unclassified Exiguobacterium TaxID=2644629 RepID=UPI00103D3AE0|nr:MULTISPECIES: hypothetical protein [unclassified Exiguobacterium]TCI47945.1 hypothetical protein EVJ31_02590 [Exiguobacterium sp. SH5S32]TCI54827.1 hypothetical protein EVJ25_02585 [Exiguobacterium sp. SH1S4]TCI74624.1 hypothetical protein EVJ23_02585 [Exiguobacterium sp. SH1S1]TCI80914.1 hypothetical protein EVJ20_06325 [Exiguobacterium sp. SH0S1]
MLSWLGITKEKEQETGRPFFGNIHKKTITFVLLSSLAILFGVKSLLTYLLPKAALADPLVAVLPGTVGVLVALVYVLVIERLLQDKAERGT